jgi:hypothetical protein
LPAPPESQDGMWTHDLYEDNTEEGAEEEPQIEEEPEVDSSSAGKVLLKNLSYEITEDKLKVWLVTCLIFQGNLRRNWICEKSVYQI